MAHLAGGLRLAAHVALVADRSLPSGGNRQPASAGSDLEPGFAGRHHVATTIADHRQGAHPEKHVVLVGDDRLNRSDTGKTGLAPAALIPAPCDAARSLPSGVLLPLTRRPTSRPIGRRRARRFPTGASYRAASRFVIAEPIVLDESATCARRVVGRLVQSQILGIWTPKICKIRNALSNSTTAVATMAEMLVRRLFTKPPITSARRVKIRRAIMGNGSARLSTT